MPTANEVSVGSRIRELRNLKGYSLRALAESSGLSANAIGLIERGENSPTVSSLRQIANALEVPIVAFFQDETDGEAVFVRRDQRARSVGDGVSIENLASGLDSQRIEPFLVTVEPGNLPASETYTHTGEEFVYCLEGVIECRVGDRLYRMEPGDSLLFRASQVHGFHNSESMVATALVVLDEGLSEEGGSERSPRRIPH